MPAIITGDCNSLGVYENESCLPHEKGVVRGLAFIKTSYTFADPPDAVEWAAAVTSNDVVVIKASSGSYDGGTPKYDKGFGNVPEIYVNSEHKISAKDPNFLNNESFYDELIKHSDYTCAFVTETLVHMAEKPCVVYAKKMVADDYDSDVVGELEIKFKQRDIPLAYTKPTGIFD